MKRPLLGYDDRVLGHVDLFGVFRLGVFRFGVFLGAAALGCGGGASLTPADSGAADGLRPGDGAVNEADVAGATGLLAANGVTIPDPPLKDPCTTLGVAAKSCAPHDACPAVICNCGGVQQKIEVTESCGASGACLTGVSCPEVCAAPNFAIDTLFLCVQSGVCDSDADCASANPRCLRSLDGSRGHCVFQQTGSDCYRDADCASSSCVALRDSGRVCEDQQVGSGCNRDDQCDAPSSGIGKSSCVLPPGEFRGECSDASETAPCLASADCLPGYGCAKLGPLGFGQCTSGTKGAPCGADADCGHGLCVSPDSATATWGKCDTGEVGATCTVGNDCRSGFCFASKCTAGTTGSPCILDQECASEMCASAGPGALMPGQCTDGKLGSPCWGVFSTQCAPGLNCADGTPGSCVAAGAP
jgi:hypothetical protein